MTTIDAIGVHSADIAMKAAADAIRARKIASVDYQAITDALRARTSVALEEAMRDTKEALDAHMDAMAEATWAASFRLAGIRAVADVYGPAA